MKMMLLTLSLSLTVAAAAQAQPTMIKHFGNWGVYSYQSGTRTICYVLTVPTRQEPGSVDHGKNFFMVSPGKTVKFEPQALMGYDLAPNSQLRVRIGDETFVMFAKGKSAWMQRLEREPEMISAMRDGRQMTVSATSRRGTQTHYTFSLAGVTAALKQADKCD